MNNLKNARIETSLPSFIARKNEPFEGDFSFHYHNYIEIELVTDGNGIQVFNGQTHRLKKGSLYVIRPTDYHRLSGKLSIFQLLIRPEFLHEDVAKKIYSIPSPITVDLKDDYDLTYSLFSAMEKECDNTHHFSNEVIKSELATVVSLFIKHCPEFAKPNLREGKNDILYAILNGNNYLNKLTLKDIASRTNYSENYISELFHKIYGRTLQSYLVTLRIDYSKKLLLTTDLSISTICMESGFNTFSNFLNLFKRETGKTPKQFRKEMGFKPKNPPLTEL